jgi:hypothetical protein
VDLSAVPSICPRGLDAFRAGYDIAAGSDAGIAVVHAAPRVRGQLRDHDMSDLVDEPASR